MKLLIVGGGIAGTTLAQLCVQQGIDFRIIDKGDNHSSVVAAGFMNPLVFRRMTLTWRVAEMLPVAVRFFREMENLLGTSFYHEVPVRRFFASEQEAGYWTQKQHLAEYVPYMKEQTAADRDFDSPKNTFGTGLVTGSGYVDASIYMESQLNWLHAEGKLVKENVAYTAIDPEAGTYKGEAFDYVIFCEGQEGRFNPWFSKLPLTSTKGELLTIHAPTISQEESLNRKCFMIPVGEGNFRIGSTYDWENDDLSLTEEGKQEILHNLTSITDEPYTIVNQIAGLRPTVPDRRPLLGKHPNFPKLVMANGLGAKGYMLAPLIMGELLAHLTEGKPLDKETSLFRFKFAPLV